MDLRAVMDGSGERWTEERHSRFLNWIENTFVHQMLGLRSDGGNSHRCAARLDRRVPDSSTVVADPDMVRAALVARVNASYTQKRSLSRYDASLDQVVPEFINKNDGEAASKGK